MEGDLMHETIGLNGILTLWNFGKLPVGLTFSYMVEDSLPDFDNALNLLTNFVSCVTVGSFLTFGNYYTLTYWTI